MSSSFRRNVTRPSTSSRNDELSRSFSNESAPSKTSLFTSLERRGTKPWIGGLTLTSSGLRELDVILGGGQPLGTVILIEEDRWTQDLALAITRYWCAEAVVQEQILAPVATRESLHSVDLSQLDSCSNIRGMQQGMSSDDLEAFLRLLPKDLYLEKKKKEAGNTNITVSTSNMVRESISVIEEGDDFEEEGEAEGVTTNNTQEEMRKSDEGLTNAWQYKQSIQRERMGQANIISAQQKISNRNEKVFCHSYDLSGRMEDQHNPGWLDQNDKISILNASCTICPSLSCQQSRSCAILFYRNCLKHIHSELALHPSGVIRMLLANAPVPTVSIALPLLLSVIRSQSLPVVLLVTVRPWAGSISPIHHSVTNASFLSSLTSLRRSCDAVFTCEGFGAMTSKIPPEFSDLVGLFSIRKMALQSLGHFADSTTNRRPPANRYGMKRNRRKLQIRMLHLPPEDFSAGGSSVGSGVRSGAGRMTTGDAAKTGLRTALKPGLACASTGRSADPSAPSLEF